MKKYTPLILVFLLSALSALALNNGFMTSFMGITFLILSFLKLIDLEGFKHGFSMYDPLTAKFPVYGTIYPFAELALALLYLSKTALVFTYCLTIFLMLESAYGVFMNRHKKISCACLGTTIQLPLTVVSFVENISMGLMALFMLLGTLGVLG